MGDLDGLSRGDLGSELARAAAVLADEPTLPLTLARVVGLALTFIPRAQLTGVLMEHHGRLRVAAASDSRAEAVLEAQIQGGGPGVEVIRQPPVVVAGRLATDARWPQWSAVAQENWAVSGAIGVRLHGDRPSGSLSWYGVEPATFEPADVDVATSFAAVAAAAIVAARTADQLRTAVESRTLIGQAQGILMERYSLSVSRAFTVLSRVSQQTNIRLVEIARDIVETRRVPGVEALPSAPRTESRQAGSNDVRPSPKKLAPRKLPGPRLRSAD